MQKPDTMDMATWVRAMTSGDRDKSKADLMVASQLVSDARAGVQATVGQSAPDDLRAVVQLVENMQQNLSGIQEMPEWPCLMFRLEADAREYLATGNKRGSY